MREEVKQRINETTSQDISTRKVSNRSWFKNIYPTFALDDDGRRKTDGRTTTTDDDDGRRTLDDGRRTTMTDDERRTTDDGRRTTDYGRRTTDDVPFELFGFKKTNKKQQTNNIVFYKHMAVCIFVFKKKMLAADILLRRL